MINNYGREIIQEQLREEEIIKMSPQLWWQYIKTYDEQCDDRAAILECSFSTMNKLGINASYINSLV